MVCNEADFQDNGLPASGISGKSTRNDLEVAVMKNLSALALALAMMVSGSVFAADATAASTTAGGASVGDAPKGTPALCPCGMGADGSLKWCPCGSEGTSGSTSTLAIVAGVAAAGVVAALAAGGGGGGTSSTTNH
jgi:hypothetical protein